MNRFTQQLVRGTSWSPISVALDWTWRPKKNFCCISAP